MKMKKKGNLVAKGTYAGLRGAYAAMFTPIDRKGRVDRLAKINEERVNLAEMEEAVCKLGFKEAVLAVIEGERGPMLGLMVAGEKIPPLKMREMLGGIFPRGTTPKKFRFVDELPRNSQGKVVAQEVKNAFAL